MPPHPKTRLPKRADANIASDMECSSTPQWKLDAYTNKPIFFWLLDLDYGYFCQWYICPITLDGQTFNCCEQYMMYQKATTFNDKPTMAAVLRESQPVKQKALGQQVKGFKADIWDKVKYDVVLRANMTKFSEGWAHDSDTAVYGEGGLAEGGDKVSMRELMLATGDGELAEASRFDRVWGIGFGPEEAKRRPKSQWGQSLLGKALMEVRERLKEENEEVG